MSLVFRLVFFGYLTFFAGEALSRGPQKDLSQYVHQSWTARDGLPANEIQSIIQTRDGYLWIGTEEGLVRFDGSRFSVFDKASGQLPGNLVCRLFQDSTDSLWIGTDVGLARYREGRFETVGREAGLVDGFVIGVAEDQAGTIWVSANYKLWRYQRNTFTSFDPRDQRSGLGGVLDVAVDRANTIWVILKGGIVCRFRDNHFEPAPEFAMLKGQSLERISSDEQGSVWISNFGGALHRYQNGEVKVFGQAEGLVSVPTSRAIRSQDGTVWLGTDLGIARISDGTCTVFQTNGKENLGTINTVYEDREGNLWTGSNGKGLERFTEGSFTPMGPDEGLSDTGVKAISEDSDHNLWVAASDGIYRGRDRFTLVLPAKDRLGGDLMEVQLLQDPRNSSLWIGTVHGLFNYQPETGALLQYTAKDGLPSDIVLSLCLDFGGALWIGCHDGLGCLKDGKFATPGALQQLTRGQTIRGVAADHSGGIWIGASSGPILYKNGTITEFSQRDGLLSTLCRGVYVGSDGAVWIWPWSGGLSLYTEDKTTGHATALPALISQATAGQVFFTLSQKLGLPSDDVTRVIDDPARGDLWIASNKGVLQVNKKQLDDLRTHRINHISGTLFGERDGLTSTGITDDGKPVVTQTYDGKLWWCTGQSVAVVDPDHLTLHNTLGPTVIENMVADDRMLSDGHLELQPGTRHLEIEYASLTYAAADKVQFRYRLDWTDRTWFNAGQRREAVFTNLGPGHYRFRVEASADGGVTWNEPGAEVAFYVHPQFYQTWWFYAACAAAGAALVWLAFVIRQRRLEARFRGIIAERVRVAGEIHDSLAQGFASAAMLLDNLDRKLQQDSAFQQRLKSVRSILGMSLADARAMIATLRGQPAEEEELELALRKLVERLEPMASAPVILDFEAGKKLSVSAGVQQELLRICQEGITNAIRHANAGHIFVSLREDEGRSLHLTVRDDGKGFDVSQVAASSESAHFGLVGLRERTKRIGAKLSIRSQPGVGTQIDLIVPVIKRQTREHPGSLANR